MRAARPLLLRMHALAVLLLVLVTMMALRPVAAQTQYQGGRRYFIFGFGSLLNTASTEKTNCGLSGLSEGSLDGLRVLLQRASTTNENSSNVLLQTLNACQVRGQRVVRIRGLQRGWYFSNPGSYPPSPFGRNVAFGASMVSLGTIRQPGSNCTGLIYEVDEAAYNATLAREVGYEVVSLSSDSPDIEILGGPPLPPGTTITYFGQNVSTIRRASADVPIAYSYIDIWLGGAVDLQRRFNLTGAHYLANTGGRYSSFLEETIKSTDAWSRHIVNDRAYPYRPFVMTRFASAIDEALWRFVPPDILRGIRFPGNLGSMGLEERVRQVIEDVMRDARAVEAT